MDIELADAVGVLRDELLTAAGRATEAEPGVVFAVGPIELEFAVELKRDAKVKTGFKAWVVSGDAEGGVAHGQTHRVKITLTPTVENGGDVRVGSGSARPDGPGAVVGRVEG
jgi:hypothetical protein